MEQEALDVLQAALILYSTFDWTNGEAAEARNDAGAPVGALARNVCSLTLLGVCKRAAHHLGLKMGAWVLPYTWLKLEAAQKYGFPDLYSYNNQPGASKELATKLLYETVARLQIRLAA